MKRIIWLAGILVMLAYLAPGASAALAADAKWTAKYYNNTSLSGTPVLERQEDSINYDWGTHRPHDGVDKDNFSVKWTRRVNFNAGTYRFTATSDDGMRVTIDNSKIIDMWVDQGATTTTADVTLSAGEHKIVVEYYERGGNAVAKFSWDTAPSNNYPDWKGEYYNNTGLSGSPALTRNDTAINFDWGSGSPASGVNADSFSVRWTRSANFNAATYRFTATTDDGMRVWVDNNLIVDRWMDQASTTYTSDVTLSAGSHAIKVEYFEHGGGAVAKVSWDVVGGTTYPDWKGEYYNNTGLSGSPALTRNDTAINFDWGSGSPATGVNADSFSVRWTRTVNFSAGTYRFTATTDDGMRVWVDNSVIIDRWIDQAAATYTSDVTLTAGNHAIKVEYYEHGGGAVAKLSWDAVGSTTYPDWKGEYYNNAGLSGSPVLTRNDTSIDFNWAYGSPASSVPTDGFAARWTRSANFNAGTYRFTASTDDGVRVWVDGTLIIDQWKLQAVTTYTKDVTLSAGSHAIKVEYYENQGLATVRLSWGQGSSGGPPGTVIMDNAGPNFQTGGLSSDWHTMNTGYNGSAQWSYNSPDARGTYNWARWYPNLTPGKYEVYVYIPEQNATTKKAQYWVHTSGGYTLKVVDQSKIFAQWVSLGTYSFSGASYEFVSLSDVSYEAYQTTKVAFDAVKFEPRP